MRLIVHTIRNCDLCHKCQRLLDHWGIKYYVEIDRPEAIRPYPYISMEYEYEELVDLIAKGVLKE